METLVTADQIRVGDIISCSCTSGCRSLSNPCPLCTTNSCGRSDATWEQVTQIKVQPALQSNWYYFTLTNDKQWGGWAKSALYVRS